MIIEALNEYVAATRRKFDNRDDTVGSSEIGLCARRVGYEKRQERPPGESWGADVRGTTMENAFWYPALKAKYGAQLVMAGPDQRSIRKGQLSATPDGLITGLKKGALSYLGVRSIEGTCILVECKSVDPRVNLREAKRENVFQVQVQLGLVRELTKHKPTYALISYTDASFWDDVTEYAIKFDPAVYAVAKARAATIFGVSDPKELKPEGWIAGGRECEYCPFAEPCGIERRRVPTGRERDVDPQFAAEITDLATEAARYHAQEDAVHSKYRDLQNQIKDRLREKGVRKIPGVVTWTEVKGRTTIDLPKLQEALEKVGLDASDYEKTGDASDRLQILL